MVQIADIGERQLIEDFKSFIRPEGRVGPGDDAAVIEKDIVITTDIVTFDRHFPVGMTYEQFGWYAAAVNFSDLAAMGARPIGFTAALALPPTLDSQNAYDIMSGIDQCAEFCGTGIIGGDTKNGPGIVAGTAIGTMDSRAPMLRSGARPGDVVAVTGPLGGPASGFAAIENDIDCPEAKESLFMPIPRVSEGIELASSGIVSSCIDLSDGLGTALNTICKASGVGIDVEFSFLQHEKYVDEISQKTGIPLEKLLIGWGGEYELMFTADPDRLKKLYDSEIEFSIIGMVNDSGQADLIREGKRSRIDYGEY
ncbi:MAG: thiamine-phosphate kinase [Candidatus Methanomethylophilaceae archaeon]|nr:thiamine-phosphate kinase [Candidatus Methanomethylophilaceae archaeon]